MYIRLPDYGEFQWYYLGVESVVGQIDQKIYANFHKPSWRTLKRHLFTVWGSEEVVSESQKYSGWGRGVPNEKVCFAGWIRSLLLTLSVNW